MNVREILDQLEECNEEATVSCIMQSKKDGSFFFTDVLRTKIENNLVDIVVKIMKDKGMTVKELKNELGQCKAFLPVFIKEDRLKPKRFPYEIIGIENKSDVVILKLPQLMADLYKQQRRIKKI